VTVVPIANEFIQLVRSGAKSSTIRHGARSWPIGPAILKSQNQEIAINITEIRRTTVLQLTETDARNDGFNSLDELLVRLGQFYPGLCSSDEVTIAYFGVV